MTRVYERGPSRWLTPAVMKARFLAKCDVSADSGCWLWTGARVTDRGKVTYGIAAYNRTRGPAHRIAYQIWKGDIGDLCVCHSCDNPRCVNPDHLWLGTRKDNNADRDRKGRQRCNPALHMSRVTPEKVIRGDKHYKAIFSAEDVKYIRDEAATKRRGVARELAKHFSCSLGAVTNVIYGKSYRNVPADGVNLGEAMIEAGHATAEKEKK